MKIKKKKLQVSKKNNMTLSNKIMIIATCTYLVLRCHLLKKKKLESGGEKITCKDCNKEHA